MALRLVRGLRRLGKARRDYGGRGGLRYGGGMISPCFPRGIARALIIRAADFSAPRHHARIVPPFFVIA